MKRDDGLYDQQRTVVHCRGTILTPLFLVSIEEEPAVSSPTFKVISVGARLVSLGLAEEPGLAPAIDVPKSSLPGGILILRFIKEVAAFFLEGAIFICPLVVLANDRLVATEGVGLPSLSFLIFLTENVASSS